MLVRATFRRDGRFDQLHIPIPRGRVFGFGRIRYRIKVKLPKTCQIHGVLFDIAWEYMNSNRVASSHRLDAWCTGGIDYSYYGVKHHETRSEILQAAREATQFDRKRQVDRLDSLAGSVILGKIDVRDDLTRVANKIADSGLPSPIKRRLIEIAGFNARQAKAEVTSSLGLAMEVARARVMNGAPCGRVTIERGITYNTRQAQLDRRKAFRLLRAQTWIQKLAVQGEAGRRVERGESCLVVAREHEILSDEALEALESKAIRSIGRTMVDQGRTFGAIVRELGITLEQSRMSLQYMIDTHVRNGAISPQESAR